MRAVALAVLGPPAPEKKALVPLNSSAAVQFLQWGNNPAIELDDEGAVAFATAYYAFVAMRWRAEKFAEAPLIVVEVNREDGTEEWLPDHELAPVFEEPSLDFDMRELLARTSHYVDSTGAAIWILDKDRTKRVSRIQPFSQREFEVKSTKDRIRGEFVVQTGKGPKTFAAEDVVYFSEINPATWTTGLSLVDVAARWLRLGERARQTVWELLNNSAWPSIISIPDKDWNPDPESDDLEHYKQELRSYGRTKGQPFVALGGGSVQVVAPPIKDLVPADILARVESAVSAIFGVPAIVLQFQVGMENSPWSQMAQARRMGYDDTIAPRWQRWGGAITRTVLRPIDDNPNHFVRFDTSEIAALQRDRTEAATQAALMSGVASVNERRDILGLEPDPDPAADEIPELRNAKISAELLKRPPAAGDGTGGGNANDANAQAADLTDEQKFVVGLLEEGRTIAGWRPGIKAASRGDATLRRLAREQAEFHWEIMSAQQLLIDADEITALAHRTLVPGPEVEEAKARKGPPTPDSRKRFMAAVAGYLKDESKPRWGKVMAPLTVQEATRAATFVAADLAFDFALVQPGVVKFAAQETGFLITNVSETTRQFVADELARGVAAGDSVSKIAGALQEGSGFSRARAKLIARTELVRTQSGASVAAAEEHSKATGIKYESVWRTAGDGRVRDEHVPMDGEVTGVGQKFSNDLEYPSEPNCRCVVLIREVSA